MSNPITERMIQRCLWSARRGTWRIGLPNYTPFDWHECDLWGVTKAGYTHEYEIKLTVSDFRADAKKGERRNGRTVDGRWRYKHQVASKHERLAAGDPAGPVLFWYVTPEGLLADEELPAWAGLIEIAKCTPTSKYIRIVDQRNGPRLHKTKATVAVVDHAFSVCYWRFWAERGKVDDLRRELPAVGEESGS